MGTADGWDSRLCRQASGRRMAKMFARGGVGAASAAIIALSKLDKSRLKPLLQSLPRTTSHVFDDFRPEASQAHQLARRAQHAQLAHTEVGQHLCTQAELAPLLLLRVLGRQGRGLTLESGQQRLGGV